MTGRLAETLNSFVRPAVALAAACLMGCGIIDLHDENFYHQIELGIVVVGPDAEGVPSGVRVAFWHPSAVRSTPEGPVTVFVDVATADTDGQGRVEFTLPHEAPTPPCCHRIYVQPSSPGLRADSLDFSFLDDVYGGIAYDLDRGDLPRRLERRITLRARE